MRTARQSRVSAGLMAATMAGLVLMAFSDSTARVVPDIVPAGALVVDSGIGTTPRQSRMHEPVPSPVELRREFKNAAAPPRMPEIAVERVATGGRGRSRDDYINAADAISRHISKLDIPVPREVVRVVALAPIDTRRLPEVSLDITAVDHSGLITRAAQSMAALPAARTASASMGRKPSVSISQNSQISQGGIKRVAGFVKRSNVPVPVRVSHPIPARHLMGLGMLRTHSLRTPAIKGASAAIVTSAHMVLSGQ